MDVSASPSVGSLLGNKDVNVYVCIVQLDEADNSETQVCITLIAGIFSH